MGRPRQLIMTRFLRRNGSTGSIIDDKATQCAYQHVRKASLDAISVTSDTTQSDVTQSERSIPLHFSEYESERSDWNDSITSFSRRVGFSNVEIRQYDQVIGDHPHCWSGCPLSLGWSYVQKDPEPITDFEDHKEHARSLDELRLSDEERRDRLVANDVSDVEIHRSLRRLYRQRECSVKCQTKAKAQFFM